MTVIVFAAIAIGFFVAGLAGIMYIDHKFALSVTGRDYAVKGRKIETDDPYVRRQFRKFYALRVAFAFTLLTLLLVVVGNVG